MNKRLIYLDLLRVYFCVAIFAYHIGALKGGYIAVCSFFAMSGYLSARSVDKDNFSLIKYYKSRLLRVYIPMLVVVFSSLIVVLNTIPDTEWISMKREVKSLIFGYNNFWQIDANLDYFARHVDSPFMHLWYVAILLQLEILFPIIFGICADVAKRTKYSKLVKLCLAAIISIAAIVFTVCFVNITNSKTLMDGYYGTATRCFSWLFGIALGFAHSAAGPLILPKLKNKVISIVMTVIYIVVTMIIFVNVPADSDAYLASMIAVSLISIRMIDHAVNLEDYLPIIFSKLIKYLSDISYEVFLIQYPVIYLMQYKDVTGVAKYALIVGITLVLSVVMHFAMSYCAGKASRMVPRLLVLILILGFSGYGAYRYYESPDKMTEMEELEAELARQEELARIEQERKEAEYKAMLAEQEKIRKEQEAELNKKYDSVEQELAALDRQIESMEADVKNRSIVFVGDSVLLGAQPAVYDMFPNAYVDAKKSRTAYVINDIFVDLNNRGMLANVIVINCGTNGDVPDSVKDTFMATLGDRDVFWTTVTNDSSVHANQRIRDYAVTHPNIHIVEWEQISAGHSEYFYGDGIHLTEVGRTAYAEAVYQTMYDYYVSDMLVRRQELVDKIDSLEKEIDDIKNKPIETNSDAY